MKKIRRLFGAGFQKIGLRIYKTPFKTLFTFLLVLLILITGVININMATGSETLVEESSEAYRSNFAMEQDFGSDSVIVLFEGDQDQLLSLNHLEKMWRVEEQLNQDKYVFTTMSPASIVHTISERQAIELKKKIPDISSGLSEMGHSLSDLGSELNHKEMPDPKALEDKLNGLITSVNPQSVLDEVIDKTGQDITSKFSEMENGLNKLGKRLIALSEEMKQQETPDTKTISNQLSELEGLTDAFNQLATNQTKLADGVGSLQKGIDKSSEVVSFSSLELNDLSESITDDPELKERLIKTATILQESSKALNKISDNTNDISKANMKTAEKLRSMNKNISGELAKISNGFKSGSMSKKQLNQMTDGLMEMGEKLVDMSKSVSNLSLKDMLLKDSEATFSKIKKDMEMEVDQMKDLFSSAIGKDDLKTMVDGFTTMSEKIEEVSEGLELIHDKSSMMMADFPTHQRNLDEILYEDNKIRPVFDDVVIDDNHMLMVVKLKGNIKDETKDEIIDDLGDAIERQDIQVKHTISGKPVLDKDLRINMKSNTQLMIGAALLMMLLILFLVFKVKWRWLSLVVIFVSIVATLGLMGHISIPMTMVSMAVFPILIGLGIDYSIQFHNRYEEEKSVEKTLSKAGKAVSLAVLATVLGFLSLYASPVPMIKDFGKMLTVGVLVCFVGSVFLLLPILRARDMVTPTTELDGLENDEDIDQRHFVIKIVKRVSLVIILVAATLAGFGLYADMNVGVQTDIESFMPQDMKALSDIRRIRDKVGSTNQVAVYMEAEDILNRENITWMKKFIDQTRKEAGNNIVDIKYIDDLVQGLSTNGNLSMEEYKQIVQDDLPESQRRMFITDELDKSVILINTKHLPTNELQDFVESLEKNLEGAPMKASITGKSVLDVEMVEGLTKGRLKMTLIGLALVFSVLLVIYRSFVKAIVAIVPVLLIVGMSGGIMTLLGLKYTPLTATLGALILGMGTEMVVMFLERYLEERKKGIDKENSLSMTLKFIGKATLASGLTTMGGFGVLMLSEFVILKDFGLMTMINISLALISTLLILPALIWLLDGLMIKE